MCYDVQLDSLEVRQSSIENKTVLLGWTFQNSLAECLTYNSTILKMMWNLSTFYYPLYKNKLRVEGI